MALVAVESIIIEKDQSWIPSHIELLAKLLGVVLSAVYLANVGHIFTGFKNPKKVISKVSGAKKYHFYHCAKLLKK